MNYQLRGYVRLLFGVPPVDFGFHFLLLHFKSRQSIVWPQIWLKNPEVTVSHEITRPYAELYIVDITYVLAPI